MNLLRRPLPADALDTIAALARAHRADAQPDSLLAAVGAAVDRCFGCILFTVLAYERAEERLDRLYSNRPDVNPIGGSKRMGRTAWTRQVLECGEPFIGRTRDDLQAVFADHEVLWSIGCGSVLNMPVVWGGKVYGALNLLDRPGSFDAADIPLVSVLAQLTLPALLVPWRPPIT